MSSPMNQMNTSAQVAPAKYTPISDTMSRHDYGIHKNKKSSTGGGRAWNEEEEVYLLQTRLQKMPYKHIASYLKKTELACRLHYHQLSHGSNRRKRTSSITSSSPEASAHAELPTNAPSPIYEVPSMQPATPPSYHFSPQSPPHVPLPSASTLLPRSASNSPPRTLSHPVAILPKPSSPRRSGSESAGSSPLRLDCDVAPSSMNLSNIDMERLRRVYDLHRASFWSQIAQEYGSCASPFILEEAWKRGIANNAPPTPCVSPDTSTVSAYHPYVTKSVQQSMAPAPAITPAPEVKHTSATSISSLLGIDANPTSPKERELIKMMEERRESRDVVMAGSHAS